MRISRTGLFRPAPPGRGATGATGTWEWASVCPPCAAPPTRWSVGPFPPRGFPPLPRYYRPIRLPTLPLPLRLPLGSAPAAPARGEGGISRVPSASRPCVPTAKAPVDARAPWPYRASAAAFPAVAYGSASTVSGISGLVPFTPAAGGFRPTGFLSTLRLGSYPPAGARLGPSPGVARPGAGGISRAPNDEQVTHWEAPT